MKTLKQNMVGRCARCGRILTDPESVARGMGPFCAASADFEEFGGTGSRPALLKPSFEECRKILCERLPDGTAVFNIPQRIAHHSPTGMEWGYGGSGPADFALNVLHLIYEREPGEELVEYGNHLLPEFVVSSYQDFKWEVITRLQPDKNEISEGFVQYWIKHMQEQVCAL